MKYGFLSLLVDLIKQEALCIHVWWISGYDELRKKSGIFLIRHFADARIIDAGQC